MKLKKFEVMVELSKMERFNVTAYDAEEARDTAVSRAEEKYGQEYSVRVDDIEKV